MDTTDPHIEFDAGASATTAAAMTGWCSASSCAGGARAGLHGSWTTSGRRQGRDYDCIVGVSGGVDSTYVAYAVKRLGLRPLAVHLDNGWDSELAVKNIENVLKKLNIDLYTMSLTGRSSRTCSSPSSGPRHRTPRSPRTTRSWRSCTGWPGRWGPPHHRGIQRPHRVPPPLGLVPGLPGLCLHQTVHRRFGTQKLRTYRTWASGNTTGTC